MLYLILELLVIFFVLPTVFALLRIRIPIVPMIWILLTYCLAILFFTGKLSLLRIDPRDLIQFPQHTLSILVILLVSAVALWLVIRQIAPIFLFRMPRHNPKLWASVMFLYPTLSVYPQGVIYRAFFLSLIHI